MWNVEKSIHNFILVMYLCSFYKDLNSLSFDFFSCKNVCRHVHTLERCNWSWKYLEEKSNFLPKIDLRNLVNIIWCETIVFLSFVFLSFRWINWLALMFRKRLLRGKNRILHCAKQICLTTFPNIFWSVT